MIPDRLLAYSNGQTALVTMQNWLFIDSLKELREQVILNNSIQNLIQIGYNSFPEMNSKVSLAAAFVIAVSKEDSHGYYLNLNTAPQSSDKGSVFLELKKNVDNFYRPSAKAFQNLPGMPIAYAFSEQLLRSYIKNELIGNCLFSDGLTKTGNNDRFLRRSWEVSRYRAERKDAYRPCAKGGETRNYYGNGDILVKWSDQDRQHYRQDHVARISPDYLWDRAGITWTKISTKSSSFRVLGEGTIAETGGPTIFLRDGAPEEGLITALGFLSSKVSKKMLDFLCPTVNFQTSDILNLPFPLSDRNIRKTPAKQLVSIHKSDWDAYETSWDFSTQPLLDLTSRGDTLAKAYDRLRVSWRTMTEEARALEEENNRIFIEAYGLKDELDSAVAPEDITLTCNPAHRYGGKRNEDELENMLRADTMRDFLSYAVGCMFGRYSLDAPGLILANQGDGIGQYLAKVPTPSFAPVADNVIPVLDGDWFAEDIAERFRMFLRITFGGDHFQENLAFIENALGKDVQKYFTRDFFSDHVRRYKKRPIYWLFASPNGTFQAMIYLHRYRPDTVGVVLNDYLRELRNKLEGHRRGQEAVSISADASQGQKTKALREIDTVGKQIQELDIWERTVLFPLASERIEIDLDDGVKANYPKFGAALKPIKGLNDTED